MSPNVTNLGYFRNAYVSHSSEHSTYIQIRRMRRKGTIRRKCWTKIYIAIYDIWYEERMKEEYSFKIFIKLLNVSCDNKSLN